MPTWSDPKLWTHRIIIFGPNERIFMRMFRSSQLRDVVARDLKLDKGQTAIAVTTDYLINGGDEPKLRD